jgi:phosphoglycolate phosphatase-like HAD superfamily hydrolase
VVGPGPGGVGDAGCLLERELALIASLDLVSPCSISPHAKHMATSNNPSAPRVGAEDGNLLSPQLLVVFDVDGTLSNSLDLCMSATNHVLTEAGHPPVSPAQYQQGTIYSTPARMAWHATGEPAAESDVGVSLGRRFDEFYVSLVTASSAPLYDGVRQVLESLTQQSVVKATAATTTPSAQQTFHESSIESQLSEHHLLSKADPKTTGAPLTLAIGALTNAARAYAVAVLKANSLSDLFAVVHGADSVPSPKPSPSGLLQCAHEVGVAIGRVLYVGDSPTDGAAAKAAGAYGVGVAWGYHHAELLQPQFDVVVHTPEELCAEIQRWVAVATPLATST